MNPRKTFGLATILATALAASAPTRGVAQSYYEPIEPPVLNEYAIEPPIYTGEAPVLPDATAQHDPNALYWAGFYPNAWPWSPLQPHYNIGPTEGAVPLETPEFVTLEILDNGDVVTYE